MSPPRSTMSRSPRLAWLITGPLAALTAIVAGVASTERPNLSPWLPTIALLAGFVVAERTILNLEVRGHIMRVSAVEIPLLIGLFAVHPLSMILARVVAAVIAQVMRKSDFVKAGFNVVAAAFSVSMAALVVASADPTDVKAPSTRS